MPPGRQWPNLIFGRIYTIKALSMPLGGGDVKTQW